MKKQKNKTKNTIKLLQKNIGKKPFYLFYLFWEEGEEKVDRRQWYKTFKINLETVILSPKIFQKQDSFQIQESFRKSASAAREIQEFIVCLVYWIVSVACGSFFISLLCWFNASN